LEAAQAIDIDLPIQETTARMELDLERALFFFTIRLIELIEQIREGLYRPETLSRDPEGSPDARLT
jgi:hypothetical protein